jgi:hypothetical protein
LVKKRRILAGGRKGKNVWVLRAIAIVVLVFLPALFARAEQQTGEVSNTKSGLTESDSSKPPLPTEAARDTGSETPSNRTRFEINHLFQKKAQSDNPGGQNEQNQQILRMDFPLSKRLTFRADVPYVWKNGDVNGLGDIFTRLTYLVIDKPDYDVFLLGDFYFPTGSQAITAGRWRTGPGFQVNAPITDVQSVLKFRIQEYFSYAGNVCYDRVNFTQGQVRFHTKWSENWWTELRYYVIVNWVPTESTGRGNTASKVELELGRKLGKHLRFYVRPGAGLWGVGQPNVSDWTLRAGIYCMF